MKVERLEQWAVLYFSFEAFKLICEQAFPAIT